MIDTSLPRVSTHTREKLRQAARRLRYEEAHGDTSSQIDAYKQLDALLSAGSPEQQVAALGYLLDRVSP